MKPCLSFPEQSGGNLRRPRFSLSSHEACGSRPKDAQRAAFLESALTHPDEADGDPLSLRSSQNDIGLSFNK